nr:hypothetical protein [Candidatus Sigynarchaeota archaeon]
CRENHVTRDTIAFIEIEYVVEEVIAKTIAYPAIHAIHGLMPVPACMKKHAENRGGEKKYGHSSP